MMTNIKLFLVCTSVMLVLEILWLGFIARDFLVQQLTGLGRIEDGQFKIILWPAVLVYIIMPLTIVLFALPKVASGEPWWMALAWGATLGFFVYGVYDFTNYATLKDWPWRLMVVDLAWGTFLFGITTAIAKYARDHYFQT